MVIVSNKQTVTEIVTINNFLSGIATLFNTDAPSKDQEYLDVSSVDRIAIARINIPMRDIKARLKEIRENIDIINETSIYDRRNNTFEKVIESSFIHPGEISSATILDSLASTISYTHDTLQMDISSASLELLLVAICFLGVNKRRIKFLCLCRGGIELKSIEDFASYFSFDSMKIIKTTSELIDCRYVDFFAYSLLYMLARNADRPYIDRLTRICCSTPVELTTIRDLTNTYEVYVPLQLKEAPVRYYLQSFCVDHPAMRFLCLYHVLEFHYSSIQEKVASSYVLEYLKEKGVSMESAKVLYAKISSFAEQSKERDQLKLCLLRYIPESDLDTLFDKIQAHGGQAAIDYYANNNAVFATNAETKIDRNQTDVLNDRRAVSKTAYEYTMEKIVKRIYSIRNFFVHSKEADEKHSNENYIPFEHDSLFEKEIALIRSLSEMFIEADAVTRHYTNVL